MQILTPVVLVLFHTFSKHCTFWSVVDLVCCSFLPLALLCLPNCFHSDSLDSKHATPEIIASLQAFQLLFPSSKREATAALFTAPMEAAVVQVFATLIQNLPPVTDKNCVEIVQQWSSKYLLNVLLIISGKEGILPPAAKKHISDHMFMPTEDVQDEHIEAKLMAWFWIFIAETYAATKNITVAQLKFCYKAFGSVSASGNIYVIIIVFTVIFFVFPMYFHDFPMFRVLTRCFKVLPKSHMLTPLLVLFGCIYIHQTMFHTKFRMKRHRYCQ